MKLNLGSGSVRLKGWQNIDLDAPEADMHLDLREKLPFGDQLITHIYNEHFIEHITREESVNLLKECYRILKNDGVLRLSTPNLKYIAVAYLSRNTTEWEDVSWKPKNPCFLMNEAVRLWGHQFVYDAEELVQVLKEAGFNSVQFVNYGESTDKELIGLETRPFHNEIIVEARKDHNGSGIAISYALNNEYYDTEAWLDNVNRSILKQIKFSEQTISEQTTNALNLEAKIAELTAHIDILTTHINKIEAEIISRGQHIIAIETDLASRDQYIFALNQHIIAIETDLASRDQYIFALNQHIIAIETDLASRDQHIADLNTHIHHLDTHIHSLEVERIQLRSSLYGKLISAARRLSK